LEFPFTAEETMTDVLPEAEAGAFASFLRSRAASRAGDSQLQPQLRPWTPADGPMPALYLSHGAPPLFNDAHWITQLASWSAALPKPSGILVVSAHWEAAPAVLSAPAPATPLVYDFWGFAPVYYRMTYPTPDASWLAAAVAGLLPGPGQQQTAARGLDHGAWVPLKVMYPEADIPVLQLSLPTDRPAELFDLGRTLKPLREQGILIIGSGFMTHGLPFITREVMEQNLVPAWSTEFDIWAGEALDNADWDELARYRNAPGMPYAHPTAEHFTPLFVTLGAAGDPVPPQTVIADYQFGLAKRSVQFG
jgi:4,5-DOPA dioxygenase extradiol